VNSPGLLGKTGRELLGPALIIAFLVIWSAGSVTARERTGTEVRTKRGADASATAEGTPFDFAQGCCQCYWLDTSKFAAEIFSSGNSTAMILGNRI